MRLGLQQQGIISQASYDPGMMTFDGYTGTYYSTSQTISGNVFTVVGRFIAPSQTTAQEIIRIRQVGGAAAHRLAIYVQPNNHATTDRRNTMEILVQASDASTAVRLPSSSAVNDGAEHTFFFSWNYLTAAYVFKIDGVDAVDTGRSAYVAPSVKTAATGSTFYISVGSIANLAAYFNGDIGYLGYGEVIATWSDFFEVDGSPKEVNESTWVQWNSTQPKYWNQYAKMDDNKGSAGNITANGTITGPA